MQTKRMGRTGLHVSEICMGTMTFGRQCDKAQSFAIMDAAVEGGIDFFDTADVYPAGGGAETAGLTEEIVGKWLKGRREDIVLATKCWGAMGDRPNDRGLSRKHIFSAVEASLQRLQTDYIDLYQAHNIKLADLEKDELFETLEQLQFEGKIRYFGVAIGPDIGWQEEGEYSLTERQVRSAQIIYSLLEQDPAKRFIELANDNEVGLLSRVPHASNTLTGEFDHGFPTFDPDDHRAHRKNEWLVESMRKVDRIRFLVQEESRSMAQAAIQFVLKPQAIVSVLPNFTTLAELKEYTSAVDTPGITDEEQTKLDELWEHGFDLSEPEPQFREI